MHSFLRSQLKLKTAFTIARVDYYRYALIGQSQKKARGFASKRFFSDLVGQAIQTDL